MRSLLTVGVLCFAAPALAGTVTGRVSLIDKGGRTVTDLSDVVVYVEGPRARPARGPNPTMTMKGKAFVPRVVVVPVIVEEAAERAAVSAAGLETLLTIAIKAI